MNFTLNPHDSSEEFSDFVENWILVCWGLEEGQNWLTGLFMHILGKTFIVSLEGKNRPDLLSIFLSHSPIFSYAHSKFDIELDLQK
jgi:hypothetical protein